MELDPYRAAKTLIFRDLTAIIFAAADFTVKGAAGSGWTSASFPFLLSCVAPNRKRRFIHGCGVVYMLRCSAGYPHSV